jgi:hypothetical protein
MSWPSVSRSWSGRILLKATVWRRRRWSRRARNASTNGDGLGTVEEGLPRDEFDKILLDERGARPIRQDRAKMLCEVAHGAEMGGRITSILLSEIRALVRLGGPEGTRGESSQILW